jgi:hypothetical protein
VVTGCINSVVICAASQDEPPFPMADNYFVWQEKTMF